MIVIGVLLLILAVGTAAVYGVANHYLNKVSKVQEVPEDIVAPENEDFEVDTEPEAPLSEEVQIVEPEDVAWGEIEPLMDDDLINILLVGQDRREDQGRQRSDVMILCSINPESGKVSLISFMRDLYVQLPGDYSDNRINAAYQFGGFQLLRDTIYENFGVTIDGCFEVDFERFKNVVDALGGVDVNLSADEAWLVGNGATEGFNHLDGQQALNYARIRYIDSDFYRTNRQRTILLSLYQKVKDASVSELTAAMDEILPMLATDMTNNQILALGMKLLPMFGSLEISSYRIPADDAFDFGFIRGMSVLIPDLERIGEQLRSEYLPLQ